MPLDYSRESLVLLIPVENIGPKPTKMCTQFKTLKIKGLRKGNTNKYSQRMRTGNETPKIPKTYEHCSMIVHPYGHKKTCIGKFFQEGFLRNQDLQVGVSHLLQEIHYII